MESSSARYSGRLTLSPPIVAHSTTQFASIPRVTGSPSAPPRSRGLPLSAPSASCDGTESRPQHRFHLVRRDCRALRDAGSVKVLTPKHAPVTGGAVTRYIDERHLRGRRRCSPQPRRSCSRRARSALLLREQPRRYFSALRVDPTHRPCGVLRQGCSFCRDGPPSAEPINPFRVAPRRQADLWPAGGSDFIAIKWQQQYRPYDLKSWHCPVDPSCAGCGISWTSLRRDWQRQTARSLLDPNGFEERLPASRWTRNQMATPGEIGSDSKR